MAMKITSAAFKEGGVIPMVYTCEGKDVNPPLEFEGVPKDAKSLVLIVDDHDVPKNIRADGVYDHWIVFNIPANTKKWGENEAAMGVQGKNSNGENVYIGPCPPDREHRYWFKLYALDMMLGLKAGASKKEVERAMQGHVIAQCQLMGRYEKKMKGC